MRYFFEPGRRRSAANLSQPHRGRDGRGLAGGRRRPRHGHGRRRRRRLPLAAVRPGGAPHGGRRGSVPGPGDPQGHGGSPGRIQGVKLGRAVLQL